ncbi:DeoR/GlpR family DNA-binding transcription regulator [Butyricicoccus faecihominis]|uniref:DeoR/GlpR family DNA-binding transcription regulator n=1 Tax=Butyricicoccus faecihominis TaxID=1712515 RepID=UPI002478B2FA|nr:DeoR/GlpR family DNA-binding transcription regulator [Butyricicoccus faecihominis]MCQ5128447.1 DeoR/GlpR family DNA-binding transcription regulator [Butyricicoccus faecihominis]
MVLPAERRQRIVGLVRERHSVTCVELCEHFDVSPGTIRKDLETLEERGVLKRTYGGAVLPERAEDKSVCISEREVTNQVVKDRIGALAAGLVADGETIFIDASSTSLFVAKHLKARKDITVITNAERVVLELCDEEGVRVICTGGALRKKNLSYVGETAEKLIRTGFYADKVFFSCCGISQKFGIFDAVEAEANIKKAMFASSKQTVLLCDSSKFEKLGFPKLADFEAVQTIITDRPPDAAWRQMFEKLHIDVLIAE